jgi:hypothetical protein
MELLPQPMPHQTLVVLCLEDAQGGTERVSTMKVDKTNYPQPDALISDHPVFKKFLWSQ